MARKAGTKNGALEDKTMKTLGPGLHWDGDGLYLQVSATGAKSWLLRYMLAGRARQMGLGSARAVSLKQARDKAAAHRAKLADGIDPIEAREAEERAKAEAAGRAKAKAITFKECAESYITTHRPSWANPKHATQWETTLRDYCKPISDVPVGDVTQEQVLAVLSPIWVSKHETATRLRSRMERVFEFAKAYKWRTAENPARWRFGLKELLPKIKKKALVKHHPALPYREIPAFMATLRAEKGAAALALEFTILCACRTVEARGAAWDEIDTEASEWIIPAARLKVKDKGPHRVPLSTAALAVLEKAKAIRQSDSVFPGVKFKRPINENAMLDLLKRMGYGQYTVHGFRSAFRDWAAEETHHSNEVCEAALAHTIRDAAEAAYRRGDLFKKRSALMQEWADYCDRKPASNVVNLADARR